MPSFLTFALVAPIAAFGGIAVGERRSGWDRPGRSAVFGLIGACLGVDRNDGPGQAALAADYGLAVRVESAGTLLADYHTAQVPASRRGRSFATRAEELAAPGLETILSWRDYRTDSAFLAAVWARGEPRWSLAEIERAMREPRYVPCLGRKSCPLGLPLEPSVADAPDALAALAARAVAGPERHFVERLRAGRTYVALDVDGVPAGASRLRVERRRDQPASRARWQFDLRDEAIVAIDREATA